MTMEEPLSKGHRIVKSGTSCRWEILAQREKRSPGCLGGRSTAEDIRLRTSLHSQNSFLSFTSGRGNLIDPTFPTCFSFLFLDSRYHGVIIKADKSRFLTSVGKYRPSIVKRMALVVSWAIRYGSTIMLMSATV